MLWADATMSADKTAAKTGKKKAIPSHPGAGRPLTSRPSGPGTAFANFLIDFMPALGMTNETIASALGYSRPNIISMWKTGKTKVTLDAVWKLSELMKVDFAYLTALYFEQYVGDAAGGVDHFPEIVRMMSRVVTPDEWDIIRTVRDARNNNSLALKPAQKSGLKKLFAVGADIEEGPLRQLELEFEAHSDRRKFLRRGHGRDMTVTEIEDAKSKNAEKAGATRKAGSRAKAA